MKPPNGLTRELDPKVIARLCRRVVVDQATGCWVWQGCTDPKGYGQIKVKGRAHRYAFVVFNGEIPPGLTVHHKHECRNPSCCNPAHLELATRTYNTADGNRHRYRRRPVECT